MSLIGDVSLGFGVESTPGTGVTPTVFPEFLSEGLTWAPNFIESAGLAATGKRIGRSARRSIVTYDGGGPTEFELFSKGLGKILRAGLGSGASNLVGGTTYQQQFTLGTSLPSALTIQKGVVSADGTVNPYTFTGCYAKSMSLTAGNGEYAKLALDWDAMNMATATALTSPSYVSGGSLFSFSQGAITIGGTVTAPTTTALAAGGTSVANVRDFNLTVDHGLASSRYNFGGAGLKAAALAGKQSISGSMTIEYTSNTVRDAILANTELGIVLTFTTAEALSTGFSQFQVYLAACFLSGDMPMATGELVTTTVNFVALDNLTAAQPIVISVRTSDSAI